MLKVGEKKENSVKLSYYYGRNLVNKKEKKLFFSERMAKQLQITRPNIQLKPIAIRYHFNTHLTILTC